MNLTKYMMKKAKYQGKRIIYVQDNAKFHISEVMQKAYGEMGVEILFTTPFFSPGNPIEMYFNDFKKMLRKQYLKSK